MCSKYLNLEEDNNESFVTRTKFIQSDPRFSFKFDDGNEINLKLIDKDNYNNNHLQVINQFIPNNAKYNNRYDVTILINGFPIVHIELKTYKTNIKQAFNQIDRYKYESFNDCKLFQFIQLFVISNETETKYFSNTTFSYAAKNNSDYSLTSDDFKSNSSFAFTIF
ncbi:type I restriction endonuclease subunit R [bacterium]|nr:type I restriction endonuclease subunit R [bacterium]